MPPVKTEMKANKTIESVVNILGEERWRRNDSTVVGMVVIEIELSSSSGEETGKDHLQAIPTGAKRA